MKEFTKILKIEAEKDNLRLRTTNNSKERKRTSEQKYQSKCDKFNYFWEKWDKYLRKCETKTQREICRVVLNECIKMKKRGV